MLYDQPFFRTMGDQAVMVELGDEISPAVNQKVRELLILLEENPLEGVREVLPSYRSLLIMYDPARTGLEKLRPQIRKAAGRLAAARVPEPKTVHLPVVYGGSYGPDLQWVADYHGVSREEVIELHAATIYQVYMIGFTPGFAYMGELPAALDTPRRDTPRTAVPKGSIGIAQRQTGVYPVQSPGGWQVIGRTPRELFNPHQWPPALLEMGDRVRFEPIKEKELLKWRRKTA
jgi:KipI family sensor histidine kinase inhibitor